jgi:hypothetical protein
MHVVEGCITCGINVCEQIVSLQRATGMKTHHQSRTQVMDANSRNINAIDYDPAARGINLGCFKYHREYTWHAPLTKRKILIASVDLPLPVRPKRPTRSLALRLKETPCKTAGNSGAYLMTRSSTLMRASLLALDGQYAGGRLDSMTAGGSCGRSKYSTTRSTELFQLGTTMWI